MRGEPAIRGHFTRPTPGRPNTTSGPGFAPEILFSRPGGNFTTPFTLDLSTPGTDFSSATVNWAKGRRESCKLLFPHEKPFYIGMWVLRDGIIN